ncbi:MAG: tetratricopeptide repeat protein [Candidatus Auribacterota bacterium]
MRKPNVFLLYICLSTTICALPLHIGVAQDAQKSLIKGSVDYIKTVLDSQILFKHGEFEKAESLLTSIVAANPNHLESWNMLGLIYLKRLNYALAENAFLRVIDIDPGFLPAYQGLASAEEALGKFDNALKNYLFFTNNFKGEKNDFVMFRIAELYTRFGKYYDAVPYYKELAQNTASPFYPQASFYLKNINENMAQYQNRRKVINSVRHIVPQQNNCMPSAMASALIFWGEPVTVNELMPYLMDTQNGGFIIDMIDYARELGYRAILYKGTINDIIHWLDLEIPVIVTQVITSVDGTPITHLRTICGYDLVKESLYSSDSYQIPFYTFFPAWNKANNAMSVILPSHKSGLISENILKDLEYAARADRFYAQENYEKAYQYYVEAEIENDMNIDAQLGQAKSLLKLNRTDEAVVMLSSIVENDPSQQEAFFLLGVVHFNRQNRAKAFEYLKKCVEVDSKLIPEAHNFLGYLYIEKGEYTEGIEEFHRSLSLKPGFLYPHYNLARTYARLGNVNQSITHLKICLDEGVITMPEVLEDSFFDTIKNTPAFKNLEPKEEK